MLARVRCSCARLAFAAGAIALPILVLAGCPPQDATRSSAPTTTGSGGTGGSTSSSASDFQVLWADQFGDGAHQVARSVHVARSGDVLAAIHFSGRIGFDGGPGFAVEGEDDALVMRLDGTGTPRWTSHLRGGAAQVFDLATNQMGDTIVTGRFVGTLAVDGAPILTAAGASNDAFVLSFDMNGNPNPNVALRFGDGTEAVGTSAAYLVNGDILIGGVFSKSIDLHGKVLTNLDASPASSDLFLARFGADGVLQWGKQFASPGVDGWIRVATIPSSSDFVVFGQCGGVVPALNDVACNGAFLARRGPAGDPIWSRQLSGVIDDHARLAVNSSGEIAVVGTYVNVAPSFGGASLPAPAGEDIFVAKLSSAGDHLFFKALGASTGLQSASGVAIDEAGNVYVAGDFKGSFNIGAGNPVKSQDKSIFLATLDTTGKAISLHSFADQGVQGCGSLDFNEDAGVLALAGTLGGTMKVGAKTLQSAGGLDAIILSLKPR